MSEALEKVKATVAELKESTGDRQRTIELVDRLESEVEALETKPDEKESHPAKGTSTKKK